MIFPISIHEGKRKVCIDLGRKSTGNVRETLALLKIMSTALNRFFYLPKRLVSQREHSEHCHRGSPVWRKLQRPSLHGFKL